jgi:hypothetical protein
MKTYYCPNGHTVFDTNDTAPECGTCGARMTLDDTAFYDVIERTENEGLRLSNGKSTTRNPSKRGHHEHHSVN